MTGLRREQAASRAEVRKSNWTESTATLSRSTPWRIGLTIRFGITFVKNNVPYNRLYDHGYSNIGCAPCTRAVKRVEDLRAGRWWWENSESKECGLHLDLRAKAQQ